MTGNVTCNGNPWLLCSWWCSVVKTESGADVIYQGRYLTSDLIQIQPHVSNKSTDPWM